MIRMNESGAKNLAKSAGKNKCSRIFVLSTLGRYYWVIGLLAELSCKMGMSVLVINRARKWSSQLSE